LAIVLPEQQNFKFMMIKPGSYFGELDILFYGDKRRYTIMTTKVSEFYVLSRKDFKSVYLHQYREEGQVLINEAMARKELIKRAYDEAL
jgi:hyperpolarization activated cyclic nucleotide-gated potassium channel 1